MESEFKLPIEYNPKTKTLSKSVLDDLELTTIIPQIVYGIPKNNTHPMTDKISEIINKCTPTSISNKLVNKLTSLYTTDVDFLKDSQNLISSADVRRCPTGTALASSLANTSDCVRMTSVPTDDAINAWQTEVRTEFGFKQKYKYVDFQQIEFLNTYTHFLSVAFWYGLFAPFTSLIFPILTQIVMFVFMVIYIKTPVTTESLTTLAKNMVTQNAVGDLIRNFNHVGIFKRAWLVLLGGLYVFSIYSGVTNCIRTHTNVSHIHKLLNLFKDYVHKTRENVQKMTELTKSLPTYVDFNQDLRTRATQLSTFYDQLNSISEYNFTCRKCTEMGKVMHLFYQMHSSAELDGLMQWTFDFNKYCDCIAHVSELVQTNKIALFCAVVDNNKTVIKSVVYPTLDTPTPNSINFKHNYIISGPNASGKTTLLKSVAISLILSQQIGFGFYEKAKIVPYDEFHSYINIPDTSDRDSLFQAEARRCKGVLDKIQKGGRHFCIFDELYSGTNPEEAEESTILFVSYLTKMYGERVSWMLTTHFVGVCSALIKDNKMRNFYMAKNYEMKRGISREKRGLRVLQDMGYPPEMVGYATTLPN